MNRWTKFETGQILQHKSGINVKFYTYVGPLAKFYYEGNLGVLRDGLEGT